MNPGWSDPILTCAEAKALEARLFGGDEAREWAAMQAAGAAVARAVLDDFKEIGGFPAAGRILVLAGKGHNGGDALLAARTILESQPAARADVLFAFGERSLRPLAARAWRELLGGTGLPTRVERITMGQPPSPGLRSPGETYATAYDLCLDGIFGFQFHPPIEEETAAVLRRVNAHPGIRLRAAVDLPSGVGEQPAGAAFRADFTYATGSVKAPLLAEGNGDAVGRLRYLDLGFFEGSVAGAADPGPGSPIPATPPSRASALPAAPTDLVLKPAVLAPLAALRAPHSDKRTNGHVFVVGGSRQYPGAVLMCIRAALRSGAGLVTGFVPETLAPAFAAVAPEAMWVGWPETPDGSLALEGLGLLRARIERADAIVLGPGLGMERETQMLAAEIVKLVDRPVVLDADALQPAVLKAAAGKPVVCLPHAGEFKRLAGGQEAEPATLRALARETGATVVLKGPVTRIAGGAASVTRIDGAGPVRRISSDESPLERGGREAGVCIYHSFFGGPVLARGGSGDLLAGLVGGLLAQAPGDPLLAACRGVVWHGLAADLLARDRGQVAVQVTQLLDYLPAALRTAVGRE